MKGLPQHKRSQPRHSMRPVKDLLPEWQNIPAISPLSLSRLRKISKTPLMLVKGGTVSLVMSSSQIPGSVIGVSLSRYKKEVLYIYMSSSMWVEILNPELILVRSIPHEKGLERILERHRLISDHFGEIYVRSQHPMGLEELGSSLLKSLPNMLQDIWLSICPRDLSNGQIISEVGNSGELVVVGQEVALSDRMLKAGLGSFG